MRRMPVKVSHEGLAPALHLTAWHLQRSAPAGMLLHTYEWVGTCVLTVTEVPVVTPTMLTQLLSTLAP